MSNIHPTAIIDPAAQLADDVTVHPYAIIEGDVVIGRGTSIGPHAGIYDGARIGEQVVIHQSASVSHRPQDKKYAGQKTHTYIGDRTVIHEFVTVHRGAHTEKTVVGSDVLLMNYVHIAHDCRVGNEVIIANSVQVAGHTHIDDFAIIGGLCPVHQFSSIGKYTMIGGGTLIRKDIPPYVMAAKDPVSFCGLNLVGLRRRGFTSDDINKIKSIYHLLLFSGFNTTAALEEIEKQYPGDPHAAEIVNFVRTSRRGIFHR